MPTQDAVGEHAELCELAEPFAAVWLLFALAHEEGRKKRLNKELVKGAGTSPLLLVIISSPDSRLSGLRTDRPRTRSTGASELNGSLNRIGGGKLQ